MKRTIVVFLFFNFYCTLLSMEGAGDTTEGISKLTLEETLKILKLWEGREQGGLSALKDAKKMCVTTHYNIKSQNNRTLGSFNPKFTRATTSDENAKEYICDFKTFEELMRFNMLERMKKGFSTNSVEVVSTENGDQYTIKKKRCCCLIQ